MVNSQGFILTNRHMGAGWKEKVDPADYLGESKAFLLTKRQGCGVNQEVVEFTSLGLKRWVPEDDTVAVPDRAADERALPRPAENGAEGSSKPLYGKNEILTVRFPNSRLSINADLVRTSTDEDVALLKINSPEPLVPLNLATDDAVKVGEKVMALGCPSLSMSTYMTIEDDRTGRKRLETIPEPTVTDGIVRRLGILTTQEGTRRIESSQGDTIQVSIQTGPGNSGGPVFNADGRVVGIITYRRQSSGVTFTYAVRIRQAVICSRRSR